MLAFAWRARLNMAAILLMICLLSTLSVAVLAAPESDAQDSSSTTVEAEVAPDEKNQADDAEVEPFVPDEDIDEDDAVSYPIDI